MRGGWSESFEWPAPLDIWRGSLFSAPLLQQSLTPTDVDIFLLMEDSFDVRHVPPEAASVFDHSAAQNLLGASVFWIRRMAALGGEGAAVADWQIKRDGTHRGILEVIP